MNLKTFLSLISAMSLAASLACVAAPARADDDSDNSNRRGDSLGTRTTIVMTAGTIMAASRRGWW